MTDIFGDVPPLAPLTAVVSAAIMVALALWFRFKARVSAEKAAREDQTRVAFAGLMTSVTREREREREEREREARRRAAERQRLANENAFARKAS